MSSLVYDREQLKAAVAMLLDPRYGKSRTDSLRVCVKGLKGMSNWFCGRRKVLRVIRDIARQPTGKILILDLLDACDRKREAVARKEEEDAPETIRKLRKTATDCLRRHRQRESAAILTERIRREERGEPQMTREETEAFLQRKRDYWNRRTREMLDEAKKKAQVRHIATVKAEIAQTLCDEEMDKLRRAKEGMYKLSDAAQRRLRGSYYKKQWARTADN